MKFRINRPIFLASLALVFSTSLVYAQCFSNAKAFNNRACTLNTYTGLAEAKFNSDTLNDILAYNSEGISILVNYGTGFDELKKIVPSNNAQYMKVESTDLNGDQIHDIVVSTVNASSLIVLEGSADIDSTYLEELIVDSIPINDFLSIDFDDDNLTDILVLSNNIVLFYKNLGNYTFSKSTLFTATSNVYNIGVFDHDNDNDYDICYRQGSTLQLLYNDNGVFSTVLIETFIPSMDPIIGKLTTADVDNDGFVDIVNSMDGRIFVRWNLGIDTINNNHLGFSTYYSSELQEIWDFAIHDWDGDQDLDIVMACRRGSAGVLARLKKRSTRSFLGPTEFANDLFEPKAVLFSNICDSTNKELISGSVNGHLMAYRDFDYYADEFKSLSANSRKPTSFSVVRNDLGQLSRVVLHVTEHAYAASVQSCERSSFNNQWRAKYIRPDFPRAYSESLIDLNNDGEKDIFTLPMSGFPSMSLIYKQNLKTYELDPTRNHAYYKRVEEKPAIGDLNGDGYSDIVIGGIFTNVIPYSHGHNPIEFGLNDGNGQFIFTSLITHCDATHGDYRLVYHDLGDMNSDHLTDIVSACQNGNLYYFEQDSSNTFNQTTLSTSDSTKGLQLYDIDLDGDLDILLSSEFNFVIYHNNGGNFVKNIIYTSSQKISALVVGDINLDNRPDIVLGGTNGKIEILFNRPSGYENFVLPSNGTATILQLSIARINQGDAYPDIIFLQKSKGLFFHLNCDTDASHAIYVDLTATGANNGQTWHDAYLHPDSAFINAKTIDSIFIAQGNYYPDTTGLSEVRDATFKFNRSLNIYGGFPSGGSSFNDRDWITYQTYLNCNLGNLTVKTDNAREILTVPYNHTLYINGLKIKNAFQDKADEPIINVYGKLELVNSTIERCRSLHSSIFGIHLNGNVILNETSLNTLRVESGYSIFNQNTGSTVKIYPVSEIRN